MKCVNEKIGKCIALLVVLVMLLLPVSASVSAEQEEEPPVSAQLEQEPAYTPGAAIKMRRAAATPVSKGNTLNFNEDVWYDLYWKHGTFWQSWGRYYVAVLNYYNFSNDTIGYCIEPFNDSAAMGSGRTTISWEDIDVKWRDYGTFEKEKIEGISLALAYGAPNNGDTTESGYYATALLVWDMATGYRYPDGSLITGKEPPFAVNIKYSHPTTYSKYQELLTRIKQHGVIPSFSVSNASQLSDDSTIVLNYDAETGNYQAQAVDTNGVLESFHYQSAIDGLTFSKSENTLTITATPEAAAKANGMTVQSRGYETTLDKSVLVWASGTGADTQLMVTLNTEVDPVPSCFRLKVNAGSLKITKSTTDSANLEGWQFSLYSDEACTQLISGPHTTGADGSVTIENLNAGTIWVKETGHADPATEKLYMCSSTNPACVFITNGQVATAEFINQRRLATIEVQKVDYHEQALPGAQFLLEWSDNGDIWQTVTYTDSQTALRGTCSTMGISDGILQTDELGRAAFTGLNPDVFYRLTEVKAPDGYQLLSGPAFEGRITQEDLVITLNVVNAPVYSLPQTGAHSMIGVATGVCICLFFCSGALLYLKRKVR